MVAVVAEDKNAFGMILQFSRKGAIRHEFSILLQKKNPKRIQNGPKAVAILMSSSFSSSERGSIHFTIR